MSSPTKLKNQKNHYHKDDWIALFVGIEAMSSDSDLTKQNNQAKLPSEITIKKYGTKIIPCRCCLDAKQQEMLFFISMKDIWGSGGRKRWPKAQI